MKLTKIFTRPSRSTRSARDTRLLVHPLLRFDPDSVNGGIQLLKLEYLEASTTIAPVPRNQDVPKEAFSDLTGRSILVATSHAWFYQCHPDPEGVKLDILRKDFFPRLRKRFPRTEILLFDDWHSCPQWPHRTEEEKARFRKCMEHMNSVYCYCDVVLFVKSRLPDIDEKVHSIRLVPAEHSWMEFIDTLQFGEESNLAIQKHDIVVGIENTKVKRMRSRKNVSKKWSSDLWISEDDMSHMVEESLVLYVRRPYGRPNRTPESMRGWLFAERFTIAAKVAMSKPECFDDVVMSNSKSLKMEILLWSLTLRGAEKAGLSTLRKALSSFESILENKRFTRREDSQIVRGIVCKYVEKLSKEWDEETKRQNDMSTRTREILLRWGSFSEDYVSSFNPESLFKHF